MTGPEAPNAGTGGAGDAGDRDPAAARLREHAREIFEAGVAAADPARAVERALETGPGGRSVIAGEELGPDATLRAVAFGKAAVAMARATAAALPPAVFPGPGMALTDARNRGTAERFDVRVGGHPVPDRAGVEAAAEIGRRIAEARAGDGLLVLVSGGGSALLCAPAEGVALEDKVETTRLLLESGADIAELNTVRKHLSALKGGGLARRAAPARVEALVLSDVVGDDLSTIASGPTAPDPTTYADARAVLERRGLLGRVPRPVRERIERGIAGDIAETPKPGDPVFERVRNRIAGSNALSLDAAAGRARALGYEVVIASRELTGEAREAGIRLARTVRRRAPGSPPLAVLAGGETTVTVRGPGRGGRNQELALALALVAAEEGFAFPWAFLSGGTDGRDGPTDAAGGLVDAGTAGRARHAGRDPLADLHANDSNPCLEAARDLLVTGPTGTNVADLQVLLAG